MNTGKTIMIIGASSDVAGELSKMFAAKGCSLILAKRPERDFEALKKDLTIRYGIDVTAIDLDATDYLHHNDILKPYLEKADDVFCFTGFLGDQEKAQIEWAEAEKIIDVNYKGLVSILNIVASSFEKRGRGNIVCISSVAGLRGRQSNYIYGSAKSALTAYLSGLRNRLYKRGVHVMTVLPGFMETKMTAHLELPPLLTASPQKAAKKIYSSYLSKKNIIYVLPRWRYIMLVIRYIPECIFKRLSL